MALITKEVENRWNGKTKRYYIEKGYHYTKLGDTFIVKVEDLPMMSNLKVSVSCDYCNKVYQRAYATRTRHNHKVTVTNDCCSNCQKIKLKETAIIRYGVTNFSYAPGVAEKISASQRMDYKIVKDSFDKAEYTLLDGQQYINSSQKLKFICNKHKDLGVQETTYNAVQQHQQGCYKCGNERKAISKVGELNPSWRGGVMELNNHLRKIITPWIADSMKQCHFKCILTSENKDWHVHHIISFNTIVSETLKHLNLPIKPTVADYTEQEISLINNKCLQLHYGYGLGVCVREDLHTSFHCQYGYGNNTQEQWNSFVLQCQAGEFDGIV